MEPDPFRLCKDVAPQNWFIATNHSSSAAGYHKSNTLVTLVHGSVQSPESSFCNVPSTTALYGKYSTGGAFESPMQSTIYIYIYIYIYITGDAIL